MNNRFFTTSAITLVVCAIIINIISIQDIKIQPIKFNIPMAFGNTSSSSIATIDKSKLYIDNEYTVSANDTVSTSNLDATYVFGIDEIGKIQQANADNFYYSKLTPSQKLIYTEMYLIMVSHKDNVGIYMADADTITRCYRSVLNDHPEIYYVDGFSFYQHTVDNKVESITFYPSFIYSATEIHDRNKLINSEVVHVINGMDGMTTDYSKYKYIFDYVCSKTDYDGGADDNQNICSVFISGRSVCQGYAKSIQYLCNKSGLDCTVVQGSIDSNGRHMWNLVKLDGDYYNSDVTWGDTQKSGINIVNNIDYDYFAVTTKDISISHAFEDFVEYPECTVTRDYYKRGK